MATPRATLLLLATACGVAILLAELATRLYLFGLADSPSALLAPSDDPALIYELRPGAEVSSAYLNPHQRDWPYTARVNAQGFRGPPPGPRGDRRRVVVLGDSYAFGFGVDDGESFPRRLEALLGDGFEVLNLGVPGYNLVQDVAALRSRGGELAPEWVVLALHWNDLEPPVFSDAHAFRWATLSNLYGLWRHLRFTRAIDLDASLERTRPQRVRAAEAAFATLLELAERWDFALLVYPVSCWGGWDDDALARLLRHVAAQGIPVLPTDPRFCADLERARIPDDGHPTAAGHRLLARRLHAWLAPRLQRAPWRGAAEGSLKAPREAGAMASPTGLEPVLPP